MKTTNESRNVDDDYDDDEEDEDGFSLQRSALSGVAKIYRLSFGNGIRNLFLRLEKAMKGASDELFTIQHNDENYSHSEELWIFHIYRTYSLMCYESGSGNGSKKTSVFYQYVSSA